MTVDNLNSELQANFNNDKTVAETPDYWEYKTNKNYRIYKDGKVEYDLLPAEYQQVDYVTSDGNAYIDTKLTLEENFKIETEFIYNKVSSDEQPVISTWTGSTNWFNTYIATSGQFRFYIRANRSTKNSMLNIGNKNEISISRDGNNWTCSLNNEYFNFTSSAVDNPTTIKIFRRGDLYQNHKSYISLGKTKITKNDELLLNLIPCYRNSDHKVGFFNVVNKEFFTNEGTGEFLYELK